MKNRDDFTKTTIDTLAKRVGYRCSNPNCRRLTIGSHTNSAQTTNIGVAAHITAAAPGGPRFDADLSEYQRKSIDNGIWLCQSCSVLIDKDPRFYPVSLLHEWKKKAEEDTFIELHSGDDETAKTAIRDLINPKFTIELVVTSPIPIKVYLETETDKELIADISIDETCSNRKYQLSVKETFGVLLYSKNDEYLRSTHFVVKEVGTKIVVNVENILYFDEIIKCCNRKKARIYLNTYPSDEGATFQLGRVGTEEDLNYLLGLLDDYTSLDAGTDCYRAWMCVRSIANLANKYHRPDTAEHITKALRRMKNDMSADMQERFSDTASSLANIVPDLKSIYTSVNPLYRVNLVINSPVAVNVSLYSMKNNIARLQEGVGIDNKITECALLVKYKIFDVFFEIDGFVKKVTLNVDDNNVKFRQRVDCCPQN